MKRFSPILYLKGMAMGAADMVPGVSGGTMALVLGIYWELIFAIKSIGRTALRVYRKDGFAVAFANFYQKMFANPRRLKTKNLFNLKIS